MGSGVWRRVVAVIVCGCVAAGVAGVSPAQGLVGSPLSWSAPALIDPGARLSGVSCPSVSLCVAVDRAGNVVTSTNPAGDASAWRIANVDPTAPACPSISPCHGLTGVSCASVALCVAVDDQGYVITSTDPTGGASAWHPANVDSGNAGCGYTSVCYGLTGVSCASASLCIAVDANGNFLASTDPTGGASAWHSAAVDGSGGSGTPGSGNFGLTGVSCPSVSLCVAGDVTWHVVTSTNPSGGARAWTVSMIKQRYGYARGLAHVSCSAPVLCVAVEAGGSLFTSTHPPGGNLAWPLTNIDGNGGDRYLTDVSCAFGTSLCAVSDSAGNVVASSNPIGGAGAWTLGTVDPGASLAGISCASGAFCFAVDNVGRVVVGQGSPPLAPVNISPPTIDGRAVLGQTLSEAHGGWANSPAMFVYQWEACDRSGNNCSTIARANGQTYRVAASDVGHAVRVVETTLNAGGTGSAASVDRVAVRPSPAMISASLRSQLVPHGPLVRIAVLLRHRGITVPFSTLTAGQLLIRWYHVPKGAHLASGKRRPVVLAIGKAHFPNAGMKNLQIKLTASGVQLLGRAKRLGVTATARLETLGRRTVNARGTFTLKP